MKKFSGCLMIFWGAFVAGLNMTRLLPTNDAYGSSWFKVSVALSLAALGIAMICIRDGKPLTR